MIILVKIYLSSKGLLSVHPKDGREALTGKKKKLLDLGTPPKNGGALFFFIDDFPFEIIMIIVSFLSLRSVNSG